jgi:Putative Actinobacterial Holin-X, holin superfamily III
MHDADVRHQSLLELAAQLTEQLTRLARAELSLARAELFARGRQAIMGGGLFGAAAVLGLAGWLALVTAAIAGIAEALPVWASALIVGSALAAVAGVLGLVGRARLRRGMPPLTMTASSVRADLHELTARREPGAAPAVDGQGGRR